MMEIQGFAKMKTDRVTVENDDQHNAVYKRGAELIARHMRVPGRSAKLTRQACGEVIRGISDLEAVTAYHPGNWAAFWLKGKGYQALGDYASAKAEFKASFSLRKEHPDVAREYAETCLQAGLGVEAEEILNHAIRLSPHDAGLHANLALVFLMSGKNGQAREAVEKSLCLSPDDKISRLVKKRVDDVLSGRRKPPNTMSDLGSPGPRFVLSKANRQWIAFAVMILIILGTVLAKR